MKLFNHRWGKTRRNATDIARGMNIHSMNGRGKFFYFKSFQLKWTELWESFLIKTQWSLSVKSFLFRARYDFCGVEWSIETTRFNLNRRSRDSSLRVNPHCVSRVSFSIRASSAFAETSRQTSKSIFVPFESWMDFRSIKFSRSLKAPVTAPCN